MTNTDQAGKSMSHGLKAGVAAMAEVTILGNLMDVMKMEKQRNCRKTYYQIADKLMYRGFLRANFIGLFPWGLSMYGVRGAGYGVGSSLGKDLLERTTLGESSQAIIASGMGGGLEGALTTPLSMMRTRVAQAQGGRATFDVWTVVKSAPISSCKRACDWMLRTAVYSSLRNRWNDNLAAFVAGVTSAVITIPIDRLLPLMQQTNPPTRIVKALVADASAKGMSAFMAGTTMRVLHGGWHTCFVFGALKLFETEKRISY